MKKLILILFIIGIKNLFAQTNEVKSLNFNGKFYIVEPTTENLINFFNLSGIEKENKLKNIGYQKKELRENCLVYSNYSKSDPAYYPFTEVSICPGKVEIYYDAVNTSNYMFEKLMAEIEKYYIDTIDKFAIYGFTYSDGIQYKFAVLRDGEAESVLLSKK